ncbi:hypothetical protein [Vibrio alginolyticus]|uniref:hypothetical protein n=1 Tax=Vibrio alginolyticus TaxID=663 RepID=UPI00215C5A1D|nr:hypothetical protein [Vibrio alginolyticus]MCR9484016.1 hypothetical protein [Vibrio alginolyticus]
MPLALLKLPILIADHMRVAKMTVDYLNIGEYAMQPITSYFDKDLNFEVKVYPSSEPKRKRKGAYVTMKERSERRLSQSLSQAMKMNAYDAAVTFGMQREEAVSDSKTASDFEVALRRERAKYNRRKA